MPANPNNPKNYFPRVKAAREAIREKALEIYEKYMVIIEEARNKGEFEVALDHLKWLMEHMPAEDGERMLDASTDKGPAPQLGPAGPTIQIGIALSPSKGPKKALPSAEVIDITPHE